MKNTSIFGVFGVIIVLALVYFLMNINYSNTNIELKNSIQSKLKEREAYFDKMWKIIQQQAQVTDQYKESFREIYTGIISGRYQNGGELMKFIQEHNPDFESSLYLKLMQQIEGQREGFFGLQSELIDINREHRNLLQKWPGSMFLSPSDTIGFLIVSSSNTKMVIQTGLEDDINVFQQRDN